MSDGRSVRILIAAIMIANLIVLSTTFLFPRAQFFLANIGLLQNQRMETAGSSDMPNQLSRTYAVVNRIREQTPEGATVFMPPGDRVNGSFRSATIQVLYPRKLFFGEDKNFANELQNARKFKASYLVYSPEWKPEFCPELERIKLTDSGFGMCEIGK
ncbi:MAG: hypothetical protein NPINA01_24370 [Nitrospinaceae bacterium]|nr:MAG: hypothetical protein NPINA01_24370 [Nitrospinaceae bacterium]